MLLSLNCVCSCAHWCELCPHVLQQRNCAIFLSRKETQGPGVSSISHQLHGGLPLFLIFLSVNTSETWWPGGPLDTKQYQWKAQVQVPPVVPATPSPTAVPEVASGRTTDIIHAVAEQSFAELGLGSYTPVGLTQNLLEFMHVNLGLPWWGAIAACTVLARCLVFPLIVKGQREAAKIHNHLPEIQKFSTRIREAKLAGDNAEFYRASKEMTLYQKKQDIKFFKPLILPLTQALVFISFFIALRDMANLPVLSMQTGGLWWFQDLTVSDPIYMLWIVVTATMWGVLELGADTGVQSSDLQWMRNVIRVSPWQSCPCHPLPLGSVHVLALLQYVFPGPSSLPPATVRTVLKIPQRVVHDPDKLPPREGFIKSFKQG
ncbi:Hypothetical predicted protein [Marmota monax]|uniref:Membrane insertase YidC/Oxa/ALB C-terminal domain-containing protein n=1 Tax=Marmota monax TaxID=9995 RepID=A0A5E4A7U1_MARMO|nr:hypothetical protein GHT09_012959 [Marmota monax]VTJ52772.1 Hypothetical predicted protein [Marmota monax]